MLALVTTTKDNRSFFFSIYCVYTSEHGNCDFKRFFCVILWKLIFLLQLPNTTADWMQMSLPAVPLNTMKCSAVWVSWDTQEQSVCQLTQTLLFRNTDLIIRIYTEEDEGVEYNLLDCNMSNRLYSGLHLLLAHLILCNHTVRYKAATDIIQFPSVLS